MNLIQTTNLRSKPTKEQKYNIKCPINNKIIKKIDSYNNFDSCKKLHTDTLNEGITLTIYTYGALLYKAESLDDIKYIENYMNEYGYHLIKPRYRNKHILETRNFRDVMSIIKKEYYTGHHVHKRMYELALEKCDTLKDVAYIKNQINIRFSDDYTGINSNKDIMRFMKNENDFNKILELKDALEKSGTFFNAKLYDRLISRCNDFHTVELFCKEKLDKGYSINTANYLNLIGVSPSFEIALEVKNHAINFGNIHDIKIYYKVIKRCNDIDLINNLLKEMKNYNILIDDELHSLYNYKCNILTNTL